MDINANKRSFLLPNMGAFTLIEVTMILIILMCILIFVLPASREFLVGHRAISNVNRIVSALYLARSDAIQLGEKVTFCKSANGKSCGGRWKDGQIIIDNKGRVLQRLDPLPGEDTLIWNSSAGKDEKVEWLSTGTTNGQRGTFYYCTDDNNADYSQSIVLIDTGRLYVSPLQAEDYARYCLH